jgi:hypothetical protein
MLLPIFRVRYPDSIAGRMWSELYGEDVTFVGELEPDGDDWDTAVSLKNAIEVWQNRSVYQDAVNPFDCQSSATNKFLYQPALSLFESWDNFKVDVSNSTQQELYDSSTWESYYSSWETPI